MGQWELHPWLTRPDIVEWCQKRGVILEAYCPIVRGQRFDEPILQPLVKKYKKTPAQVLLRWSLQKVSKNKLFLPLNASTDTYSQGFVPLPKSVTHSRIEENADIYDFDLTPKEMETLETGDYSPCSWDPTISND